MRSIAPLRGPKTVLDLLNNCLQRYSIGEQLRRLLHLLNRKTAGVMLLRLEYLSTWDAGPL